MKIVANILVPPLAHMSSDVFDDLVAIYPEGKHDNMFLSSLPVNDSRTLSIMERLQRAGFKPWENHSHPRDKDVEYSFNLKREYDLDDLASCSLLELHIPHQKSIHDAWRDEKGRIKLRGRLRKDMDFGKCTFQWFVVPDRVKHLLENSGLRCIAFRETVPMAKTGGELVHVPDWSFWGKPWWELDSDFTMPLLSPSMTFVDRSGKPAKQGDYSNGLHAKEGLFNHAELHYRASDLQELEPFDLARTAEPFSNRQGYDPFDRPLVASKRFYEFCLEHKLKADWIPVRIDDL